MNKETKKMIDGLLDKLIKEYRPERVILFGSYAWGKPKKESDLDLLIVKRSKKNRVKRFVEVKKLLFDPSRDTSVSPLVLSPNEIEKRLQMGDDFIREILEKGKLLYSDEN